MVRKYTELRFVDNHCDAMTEMYKYEEENSDQEMQDAFASPDKQIEEEEVFFSEIGRKRDQGSPGQIRDGADKFADFDSAPERREEYNKTMFLSMSVADDAGQEDLPDVSAYQENMGPIEHTFEEKYVKYNEYGLREPLVTDCELIRTQIPGNTAVKVKMSMVLKMLKDLIGKDLSKFSLPVFINEPSSVLQKPAEQMFFN